MYLVEQKELIDMIFFWNLFFQSLCNHSGKKIIKQINMFVFY